MSQIAEQILALSVVLAVFTTLQVRRNVPTEVLFSLALAVLILFGVIEPEQAWQCFAHPAVIAIAGMLVVSAALRSAGVLDSVGRSLLGNVKTELGALSRLAGILITASAFLLNTALVAMLLPVVISWCRRMHITPSRLLLPISYLTILGGTCTLVGTSTNFVVNGNLQVLSRQIESGGVSDSYDAQWVIQERENLRPMGLTEISRVGVPCAIFGAIFLILAGRHLLPVRPELLDSLEDQRREYLLEMLVQPTCALVGKTVEEGGLRHLPGLFLIEIDRDGDVIAPVSPSDRIRADDRLVFTGVVATIVDLEKIPGLVPAADINYEISTEKTAGRSLVEVVLSPSSPLVGSTIRDANFRHHYSAAVVAVHRNGQRLPTKIGDIELAAGDTLLLQTQSGFVRTFRNRPDFYLISSVEDGESRRHDKLFLAATLTLGLIGWLFLQPFLKDMGAPAALAKPEVAIFAAAICLIVTRCLSIADARQAIDLPLLITVGAAIGVGTAIGECKAAHTVAQFIVGLVGNNPHVVLVTLFILTVCFTEMLSNVAVAAIMFPIALQLANQAGVSPRPFIIAITIAASLSFMSPIGYQTNLMVMGPGGYRPADYLRAGLPLSLLVGLLALLLIPLAWPF